MGHLSPAYDLDGTVRFKLRRPTSNQRQLCIDSFAFVAPPACGRSDLFSRASMQPVPRLSPKVTVMVLFTKEASKKYISPFFLAIKIAAAYLETNVAMEKSLINLNIDLVHVGEVSAGGGADQCTPAR